MTVGDNQKYWPLVAIKADLSLNAWLVCRMPAPPGEWARGVCVRPGDLDASRPTRQVRVRRSMDTVLVPSGLGGVWHACSQTGQAKYAIGVGAQSILEERHFCPEIMYEQLTKFPNFT